MSTDWLKRDCALEDASKFKEALKIMKEYHDAQMACAAQAGPEDMGEVDVELIVRRAMAGGAICQFYRENS